MDIEKEPGGVGGGRQSKNVIETEMSKEALDYLYNIIIMCIINMITIFHYQYIVTHLLNTITQSN